jgi:hypothetical protein
MPTYLVTVTKGEFLELQQSRFVEIDAENSEEADCLARASLFHNEWVEDNQTVKVFK